MSTQVDEPAAPRRRTLSQVDRLEMVATPLLLTLLIGSVIATSAPSISPSASATRSRKRGDPCLIWDAVNNATSCASRPKKLKCVWIPMDLICITSSHVKLYKPCYKKIDNEQACRKKKLARKCAWVAGRGCAPLVSRIGGLDIEPPTASPSSSPVTLAPTTFSPSSASPTVFDPLCTPKNTIKRCSKNKRCAWSKNAKCVRGGWSCFNGCPFSFDGVCDDETLCPKGSDCAVRRNA